MGRLRLLLALVALALLGLVLLRPRREATRDPASAPASAPARAGASARSPRGGRAMNPAPSEPRRGEAADLSLRADRAADDPVATYLESARYPPHSRRLTRARVDLLHWNARHERPRPSPHDPRATFLFSADRYWLQEGERATVILRGWVDGQPSRVEALATSVEVVRGVGAAPGAGSGPHGAI